MSGLILPPAYSRRSNPLAEFLRERDAGDFADTVAMTAALCEARDSVAKGRHMSNKRLFRALIGTLASAVQAAAPEEEWAEVAAILSTELKARLDIRDVR